MSRRLEVERHIAADPASVALLLAGAGDDHDLAIAPPRRSGIGFVAAVTATVATERPATGHVRITPAEDLGCQVTITLVAVEDAAAAPIRRSALKFLASLALRARERSYAA